MDFSSGFVYGQVLSDQFRTCMLCPAETCPQGLNLVPMFPGLPVIPQFPKMIVELAPPRFVDGEMRLASVELPVLFGKLVSRGDF